MFYLCLSIIEHNYLRDHIEFLRKLVQKPNSNSFSYRNGNRFRKQNLVDTRKITKKGSGTRTVKVAGTGNCSGTIIEAESVTGKWIDNIGFCAGTGTETVSGIQFI